VTLPLHDWIEWTGFWFTVIGTSVTIVGLWYTFRAARGAREQADRARNAADAARDAATRAADAISERTTIADLATLRGGFQAIVGHLEVGRVELALFEVRLARQRVNELRQRPGLQAPREDMQKVVGDLAGLQELLEQKLWNEVATDLPLTDISKLLSQHADQLSTWAEQMRYQTKVLQ
jgi:hypothetical protein